MDQPRLSSAQRLTLLLENVTGCLSGVAACQINGVTLHSFAGIGAKVGEQSLQRSYELALRPTVAAQWKKCKHLIIDEISMVDADYFDRIEQVSDFKVISYRVLNGFRI